MQQISSGRMLQPMAEGTPEQDMAISKKADAVRRGRKAKTASKAAARFALASKAGGIGHEGQPGTDDLGFVVDDDNCSALRLSDVLNGFGKIIGSVASIAAVSLVGSAFYSAFEVQTEDHIRLEYAQAMSELWANANLTTNQYDWIAGEIGVDVDYDPDANCTWQDAFTAAHPGLFLPCLALPCLSFLPLTRFF